MDCSFNVSSFQEMTIDVVNHYITLLRRIVRKGGYIILENLKASREIPGNSFDLYDLSGFGCDYLCAPRYGNYVIRNIPELESIFYRGKTLWRL